VLCAVALELHQDLGGRLVVGGLEDLDHVVAAERDIDPDQAPARRLDHVLALFDPLAPGGQARDALRSPAHQRHVVRHQAIMTGMRLNAYLARTGVASRRGADELIKAGRVLVNGEPGQLNTFVETGDRVELDGEPVTPQRLAYVLLHKPAGVVTTARDPHGRPTVVGLVDHEARIVPVGRLDADTTGALLLTNDGELAHRLAHPRYKVEKVYEAEVDGAPSDDALTRLERGLELDDGPTAPARARRLAPGTIELTIHEGRKHQVKRMLAAVGHPVLRLHRSRYAGLTLEGLGPGESRELTGAEVERLRSGYGEPAVPS
jgi:23S rRNA pseudouridine2605 synthase